MQAYHYITIPRYPISQKQLKPVERKITHICNLVDFPESAAATPVPSIFPQLLIKHIIIILFIMVVGCGPETFRIGLGNTVADSQNRVLARDCRETALHLEMFRCYCIPYVFQSSNFLSVGKTRNWFRVDSSLTGLTPRHIRVPI
jgi:hypothetical protein